MAFIKRKWTAEEADEWTKEDLIASVLAIINYICLTIGLALSLLLIPIGFLVLGIGIIATILMIYVIDPKLEAISAEYELKQKMYLDEIEKQQKWEEE